MHTQMPSSKALWKTKITGLPLRFAPRASDLYVFRALLLNTVWISKKMRRRLSVSDVRDLAKAWAVARKMAPASQIYVLKVWGQLFCITANITGL